MADSIVIKGIKQGVLVQLDDSLDWQLLVEELCDQIDQRGSFFRGAEWVIDVDQRHVSLDALVDLRTVLEARQVELRALLSTNEDTLSAAQALDIPTDLGDVHPEGIGDEATEQIEIVDDEALALPEFDSEVYGTGGVLIKRTLRSGRTVRSMGHVVVIGDVNAGAEVVATGDIVVWGKVRGVVHAGAQGDESAVICALDLAPTQLRIASLITVPPDERGRVSRPEMARVNDGQIEAAPWV